MQNVASAIQENNIIMFPSFKLLSVEFKLLFVESEKENVVIKN